MKGYIKKGFSVIVAVLMIISCATLPVYGEETDGQAETVIETQTTEETGQESVETETTEMTEESVKKTEETDKTDESEKTDESNYVDLSEELDKTTVKAKHVLDTMKMTLKNVSITDDIKDMIKKAGQSSIGDIIGVDISMSDTITDNIDMTIINDKIKDMEDPTLYHISEKKAEKVKGSFDKEKGQVTFETKDFSPYIIVDKKTYTITIKYIYESDGSQAVEDYVETREVEEKEYTFSHDSPYLENYSADKEKVELTVPAGNEEDIEEIVTYKADKTGATLTATLVSGEKSASLDEDGMNNLSVGFSDGMSLRITAEFGAGTDKIIEVHLPVGMSYRYDVNSIYTVNNLDNTFKEKITPPNQSDESKKNVTVLGSNQYNGTMTLKFHGSGEDNDAKKVSFTIPLRTAYGDNWNSGLWESGTAWFYDTVKNPVTVTQYINGDKANEITLGQLNISTGNDRQFRHSWAMPYNPEVIVGKNTSGDETWTMRTLPGGGTYPRRIAVKKYSVTYLAPDGVDFVSFKSGLTRIGNYKNTPVKKTTGGNTTEDGYEVPEGYNAYTFTLEDTIIPQTEMTVNPIWSFSDEAFEDGDTATISVVDFHLQYYGREKEETFTQTYPSLTYLVRKEYEEVFCNVAYQNKDRLTDAYISDYTLQLGSPGLEHVQERYGGYFIIGNRGLGDSVEKTITIEYDTKNTGALGITQQELPVFTTKKVSNVKYKLYDASTGEVTDWKDYTGTSNVVNLQDLGVKGNTGLNGQKGQYIKALQFDIETLPKQAYLKSGNASATGANTYYSYYCVVLSDEAIKAEIWGQLEHRMTISNKNGNDDSRSDTASRDVVGRCFNGTTGRSLIIPNTNAYRENYGGTVQVGVDKKTLKTGIFFHDWATDNAQLVDYVYMISPYGEDYDNITVHTNRNANVAAKTYMKNATSPQPKITEVNPSEELLEKYPKAKVYKLDFTDITDPQEMYDMRLIGNTSLVAKSNSNSSLSTSSQYCGLWITYDYAPDISDPTGTYNDNLWVQWHTDTTDGQPYTFVNSGYGSAHYEDIFKLSDHTESSYRLGKLSGPQLTPTEGLEVSSAAKQKNEVDSYYRTYKSGEDDTVLGIYSDAHYKLTVHNKSSLPVNELNVYFPIPKAGENWGSVICPEGAFKFSLSLSNALKDVPEGYEVYYVKNASPTNQYASWDNYDWVKQSDTENWKTSDWNEVNFVKMVWVGTEDKKTINYPDTHTAIFDLRVDTLTTTSDQMYKLNVWRPYFLRGYTNSSSWVAGEPIATRLTPGLLSGYVWNDRKVNGKIDEGEPYIEGVKVELYDLSTDEEVLRAITYTDENGYYSFDGLKDGTAESGGIDTCNVIVYNPDDPTDTSKEERYVQFTLKDDDTDMIFDVIDDTKANITTDTQTVNAEKNKKLDAGLLRTNDIPYTIEYYYQKDDGTYPENPDMSIQETGTLDEVATITDEQKVPDKKYPHHIFDEENTENILSAKVKGDWSTVLKVYFKLSFTVTYNDGVNNEEVFEDKVFDHLNVLDDTPRVDDPVRPGYIFKGWTPEVKEKVTGDITYKATWEARTYTITYDTNGGIWDDGTTDNKTDTHPVTEGATIFEAPVREGYEFVEWKGSTYQPGDDYNEKDDEGFYVDDTLVAQWKKVEQPTPEEPEDKPDQPEDQKDTPDETPVDDPEETPTDDPEPDVDIIDEPEDEPTIKEDEPEKEDKKVETSDPTQYLSSIILLLMSFVMIIVLRRRQAK